MINSGITKIVLLFLSNWQKPQNPDIINEVRNN